MRVRRARPKSVRATSRKRGLHFDWHYDSSGRKVRSLPSTEEEEVDGDDDDDGSSLPFLPEELVYPNYGGGTAGVLFQLYCPYHSPEGKRRSAAAQQSLRLKYRPLVQGSEEVHFLFTLFNFPFTPPLPHPSFWPSLCILGGCCKFSAPKEVC